MKKAFYLSPDGTQVSGPHSAFEVIMKWRKNEIPRTTKICEEGSERWQEMRFVSSEIEELAGFKPEVKQASYASYAAGASSSSLNGYVPESRGGKSEIAAFILNLLLPGVGHFYLEQNGKGVMWMLISIFGTFFSVILFGFFGFFIGLMICIVAAITAMHDAKNS